MQLKNFFAEYVRSSFRHKMGGISPSVSISMHGMEGNASSPVRDMENGGDQNQPLKRHRCAVTSVLRFSCRNFSLRRRGQEDVERGLRKDYAEHDDKSFAFKVEGCSIAV